MDKSKIFKIVVFLFFIGGNTWAQTIPSQDDNVATEEEGDLEPMKELPNVKQICPNLDRALSLSTNKYKLQKVKIYDPFFKSLKLELETSSLCKDLWYVIAQRKSKNRDYNFDIHGRIGIVYKHNFYIGGDCGFSTGKECVWEGDDARKTNEADKKKLDTKFAHLSRGLYANAMVGYNYIFDKNNDVVFAAKFGWSRTTIEKLKDQTFSSGDKTEYHPCWIGFLIAVENRLFGSPLFWGFDLQANYLINRKDIEGLENYFIPDYGHSKYKLNFGFNLFLGLKFDLEQEIIVP